MTQDLLRLIAQLEAIEWGLRNTPKQPAPDPLKELALDIGTDLAVRTAGDVAQELLGRRRTVTRFAKRQALDARAAKKAQAIANEKRHYLGVLDSAETLLNAHGRLLPPRTIASLRSDAMKARNATQPATIARRTLAYLGRARVSIQGALDLPPPSAMLHQLERALRDTIKRKLSNEPDWWGQRIPNDVRQRAEDRAQEKAPLLDYVDFPDYQKIIIQKNNWDQHFRSVFKNRDWLTLCLIELSALRNEIAHSRPLSYDQAMKFRVLSNDIIERTERARKD